MAGTFNQNPVPGVTVNVLRTKPGDKPDPNFGKVKADVPDCPRCGKGHGMVWFRPLANADREGQGVTSFCPCPATGQPIIGYSEDAATAGKPPKVVEKTVEKVVEKEVPDPKTEAKLKEASAYLKELTGKLKDIKDILKLKANDPLGIAEEATNALLAASKPK